MQLRWGMLALSVLVLVIAGSMDIQLAWLPLVQALLTLVLINGALIALRQRHVSALWLVRVGILADVLCLSELLLFSGGAANPMASLYLPPVLFAALLSPGLFAWGVTLLAMSVYGLLFFLQPTEPMVMMDAAYAFHEHQLGMWLTFTLSALLMTGFISYLARQLSVRDSQLALAREIQLRDEQLVALGMQAAAAAHALSTPLNTLSLLVDEWDETDPLSGALPERALMQGQLGLCRAALVEFKRQAQTGPQRLPLFSALTERLSGWRALRPDVTLEWQAPATPGPLVSLEPEFWPALFNLVNNAAEAGGGLVAIDARYDAGEFTIDIVNREGCLSVEQLAAAGLTPLPSDKVAGMGLGMMLSHATLARLGGSLTLDNRSAGGVHARIVLPLLEESE